MKSKVKSKIVINYINLESYTAKTQPNVQTGRIRQDEAILDFYDNFEFHHSLYVI